MSRVNILYLCNIDLVAEMLKKHEDEQKQLVVESQELIKQEHNLNTIDSTK